MHKLSDLWNICQKSSDQVGIAPKSFYCEVGNIFLENDDNYYVNECYGNADDIENYFVEIDEWHSDFFNLIFYFFCHMYVQVEHGSFDN